MVVKPMFSTGTAIEAPWLYGTSDEQGIYDVGAIGIGGEGKSDPLF